MKEIDNTVSISFLCGLFEISRQAYYQHEHCSSEYHFQSGLVLEEVKKIRARHRRMGVRKIQEVLRPFMDEHKIKMGRDALFDLVSYHGLLVRKRKRRVQTTYSHHWLKKYENLIVDFIPSKPNELWVSDITYWKLQETYVYLTLITDAYSRKIVGYHLSENLYAEHTVKALKMALSATEKRNETSSQLIHHSDRGVQYCSSTYVNVLKNNHISISMTQSGDPLENAIAERVNGIIKDEYLYDCRCSNINEGRKRLDLAISLYNKERPHSSIGNLTPDAVHKNYLEFSNEKIKRLWKN